MEKIETISRFLMIIIDGFIKGCLLIWLIRELFIY